MPKLFTDGMTPEEAGRHDASEAMRPARAILRAAAREETPRYECRCVPCGAIFIADSKHRRICPGCRKKSDEIAETVSGGITTIEAK